MKFDVHNLSLERLDLAGVKTLIKWAASEGWDPGLYDAEVFYNTDPEGFVGYYFNEELIAAGSIVSYDGKFGFMGFFIVQPSYRSQGLGRQLWYERRDLLLSRLNRDASIGMDGVVSMQPFYKKGGFQLAFKDERHVLQGQRRPIDANISPVNISALEAILEYDQICFGFPRPQFLKPWLDMPGCRAFQYYKDGQLCGFTVLRKTQNGWKIGPLFADSRKEAEALYDACLDAAPGESVFLDIPHSNQDAVKMVKKYKAQAVFECARMYYGPPPTIPINKVFGITSFELG